ncbi:hypothetical protein CAEBREN_00509 [Caenorhabditis brenneri]|uniref:Sdz-33 F-box domain-containing protein n=1 Tax=Caenorhabditis brenneri TaxID=135651 RepID=G0MBA2_CAEBE|nr:hypothetical protein CAEBREN_00509 [Caenorhabditis brenneri]
MSLTSNRCKKHVLSLKIKAKSFGVSIQKEVNIDIRTSTISMYIDFPTDETVMARQRKKLKTPACFKVALHGEDDILYFGLWEWTSFEYGDWLEHLREVFHYRGFDRLSFHDNSFLYDLDDIKKVFGKPDELLVEHTGCYYFNQLIFKKFFYIKNVQIDMNISPEGSNILSTILTQNIDELYTEDIDRPLRAMNLEDLLMINSKSIEIHYQTISSKDMNMFIKLWMKGSNPRLEYLEFEYFIGIPQVDEIMEGIKYTKASKYECRYFKRCRKRLCVSAGIEIQRRDGTRATIKFTHAGDLHSFEMLVWHDHCVADRDDIFFKSLGLIH